MPKPRQPRMVRRKIENGQVRINGRIYRPAPQPEVLLGGRESLPYDGRLDGQWWWFGLYYGECPDKPGVLCLKEYVSLWGSDAYYRGDIEFGQDSNIVDGVFHWVWWNADDPAEIQGSKAA